MNRELWETALNSKFLRYDADYDPAGGERVAIEGDGSGTTHALLRAYRESGDLSAREWLIRRHLPLVRVLARRYAHRGERLEDLVQVGSIGLIEAIDRFDPAKGSDFVGFAVPTIAGEIKTHLRDKATVVRVPRRVAQLNVRLRAEQETLAARLRRAPTLSELAAEAGVREADAAEAIATSNGSGEPPDGVVDDVFEPSDDRLLLAAGFRTLEPRQRRILHLRFYAGLSQAEIAREVGLSQIQVSRVIRASLERMRAALGREAAPKAVENPLVRA
jgi:RNA polymerase sigma-B factor